MSARPLPLRRGVIPQKALAAQAQSSDPQASVWVSANAGSGKTHVLTERVIRLLLNGTDPAHILCLTYTKAAAAVMQTRIFDRLSAWTRMDDTELAGALQQLEGKKADAQRLKAARRLFARALETPGGLKIQTIHAFCEALLHQFPLEANIAGHFDMIDDMQQTALVREARRHLLETAFWRDDEELACAFELCLAAAGESGLERLFEEAVANRQAVEQSSAAMGRAKTPVLRDIFGLETDDTAETLAARLREAASFSAPALARIAALGGENAARFVEKLEALEQENNNPEAIRTLCLHAYFNDNGSPRKPKPIFTKAVQAAMPDAPLLFLHKQQIVAELAQKLTALELVRLNMAAYKLMDSLLARYAARKRAQGLLDFDDLIHRALALLQRRGAGQWVQYKLDRGIDHILVDEAQDTSPAQWEIVRLLSHEFFSGLGQRDVERTVFAVGDEKQSIYSFQGAVPEDFAWNGGHTGRRAASAGKLFRKVRLDFSFRSTRDVLSAVDTVFSTPENHDGLSADNEPTVHDAVRSQEAGAVDIWQMLTPEETEEPEDWRKPVDHLASPAIRLAGQIAETIDTWLKSGELLPGKGRPLQPSDIMVLVRKRGQFVHALSRALKNRGVAVAGADRLHLSEHIAIRDLMALGHFVLQPHDDLSLAAVLKSPLFGMAEEQLFNIAANRRGTLWAALEQAAHHDAACAAIAEELQACRALADITPVFEFYCRILSQNGGRRKILARLGVEASDVLDAFLDYSLAVQKTGLPGLQAFLETLAAANPEIKRELDQNRDEVRIMTVHAAKGLEAPVVFLVDSGSRIWNSQHEPKLLPVHHDSGRPDNMGHDSGLVLIWQPTATLRTAVGQAVIDTLKKRAEQEYRRLLYVGMTRAQDRLIVCGYRGRQQAPGTWLPTVLAALLEKATSIAPPAEGVTAWRYQLAEQGGLALASAHAAAPAPLPPPVPDFLKRKAVPEPDLPRPLAPSRAALTIESEPAADPDRLTQSPVLSENTARERSSSEAVERGSAIHRLLQYLPDAAPQTRRALAVRYLERILPGRPDSCRRDILAHVFAILDDARFQPLFVENSRAEAALMGVVDIGGVKRAISGQIDRLAIAGDQVLLADFKTGRPPLMAEEIPQAYLLQMALYARLLEPLYPEKEIRPALVYTQAPILFALDREKLNILLQKLGQKAL